MRLQARWNSTQMAPKLHPYPVRKNPFYDGLGVSSGSGQPSTCALQPARCSQRAARATPAKQTAVQTQHPGSSAGPSSLLAPITGLSASEAAAGLPLIHRPRTRSEQRASLEHAINRCRSNSSIRQCWTSSCEETHPTERHRGMGVQGL